MSTYKLIAFAAASILLIGCSQQTLPDPEPTDTTYGADDAGASTSGMDGTDPYGGEEFGTDPSAGELATVIYFEFDSSEVRAEDQDIVIRHARQLSDNPGWRVRLEGHADERGSREYNIGLGERRSQAVAADQISTVSFGEERPVSFGSSESDYAQNRRVEFKYTN